MNKLKRILSLSFLTIMLGIPIYTLTNYYQEVEAATYTPILKIRYLDKGDYRDIAYNAGGKINEENTIVNNSIKEQFHDKGVKDPYSGVTVKLTDSQYNSLKTKIQSLPSADGSNGVEKETGSNVRYVVWYQFDKKRMSTNYWKTEGYYVTPTKINVGTTTSDTINTDAPGFYLDRNAVSEVDYPGQNGQTWTLTIFAARYDYLRSKFEELSDDVQEEFQKSGDKRIVLWLQPAIGIYKNKQNTETCLNLQSWLGALNWSNPSTFKDHYNLKVSLNMTNEEQLFVHYVREGTIGTSETEDGTEFDYPYGKPVVDESGIKFDEDKIYSKYNYTPGDDAANEANGIWIAAPSTFQIGKGPRDNKTQERIDIFKPEIVVTKETEDGELEEVYWSVSGVQLIYTGNEAKKEQRFKIKFQFDNGKVDFSLVEVLSDNTDQSYQENQPAYSKGQEISYEQFLEKLKTARLETASAGDTIVIFEYKKTEIPFSLWSLNPGGGNNDYINIEYQYQTFDAQGNEVWKTFAADRAEVPENRVWSKEFDKLASQPYQNYGIYSVFATDTTNDKKLLNRLTNKTETIAKNFYDTTEWEAEADAVRKVQYVVPEYTSAYQVTVTVRYAARMPMIKLSYLATPKGTDTTYSLVEGPTTIGKGGAGQTEEVEWDHTYDVVTHTTVTDPDTGEVTQVPHVISYPLKFWYVTEGNVAGLFGAKENYWTSDKPPNLDTPTFVFKDNKGTATYQELAPTLVVAVYGDTATSEEPDDDTTQYPLTIKYEYQTFDGGEVVWKEMKKSEGFSIPEDYYTNVFPALGSELTDDEKFQYYGIYSVFATNNKTNELIKNELSVNQIDTLEYFNDDQMWLEKNNEIRSVKYKTDDVDSMTITVRYAARMPMIKLSYVKGETGYQLQGEPVNLGLGAAGQTRTVTWESTISNTDQDKNYVLDKWFVATGDVKGFCGTTSNCWTETTPPDPISEGKTSLSGVVRYEEFAPTIVFAIYKDPNVPTEPTTPDPPEPEISGFSSELLLTFCILCVVCPYI